MTDTPRPRRAVEPVDDSPTPPAETAVTPAPRPRGPWLQVVAGAFVVGLIAFVGVWAVRINSNADLKAGECVAMEGGDTGASHKKVDCAATDQGLVWKVTAVGKDENGCGELQIPYVTRDARSHEIKSVACLLPQYRDGVCYDEATDLPKQADCTPVGDQQTLFKVVKHLNDGDADCADVPDAVVFNYSDQNLTYCAVAVGD